MTVTDHHPALFPIRKLLSFAGTATLVLGLFLPTPVLAEPTLPEWIEADWVECDQEYGARENVEPFSLRHIQAVLERGKNLAERLAAKSDRERLEPCLNELRHLEEGLADFKKGPSPDEEARRAMFLSAKRTVRGIAFANPLFDFNQILFIKRHLSKGVFHMCDQFYGFNAVPGGGLFVLTDPFGANPKLTNLLENSEVTQGRLKGHKLEGGAFLSPELSFDGNSILFAYSDAGGQDLEWTPESSNHLFRVNTDGSGLVQLTDGPWNDFDPCFLPDGRIAFITERRGGYLRCGRHCPVYTMFSMEPDGSGITCLSFHETHEWHPSVTNDGMIVYTRWDYVDRDTNIAHHIWTCYPDGRDPRSFHGNYPDKRESRPWMEMDIRAIPGSRRFVATAGAHHGHAFGSLVLIDPEVEDDGSMSQLVRLTPDVPFPEAEKHLRPIKDCMVYATAWPLSEEDFLCVYDSHAANHGIYWIDAAGNKELLYRDPSIPCLSPIPLRPRPQPPVIPRQTGGEAPATIALMNVYNSDFEWPGGTKISALRILQVLPKTTPPPNEPRIGVAEQTNARAVLGTVPVESDGSAYFEAPVGKELYFQALDEKGMAVQSMRSGTYVHPGERLTCMGCHEPKHRAPLHTDEPPLALRRPPSPIEPDVEGSNPFNFVRLVQPVLDRHCVTCHQEQGALDLTGAIEGSLGWTRAYQNLAGEYGFYFHVRNGSFLEGIHGGSRTLAGQFGARASRLLDYLDSRHHGVSLPAGDFHRVALWLDCNSEFFGAYENPEAQARGEVVIPSLD
jgi:hypothetical protein